MNSVIILQIRKRLVVAAWLLMIVALVMMSPLETWWAELLRHARMEAAGCAVILLLAFEVDICHGTPLTSNS